MSNKLSDTIDGINEKAWERAMRPKAHRGVFYYASYDDARIVRDNLLKDNPLARIVEYERGYAIQRERSGRYFGPETWDADLFDTTEEDYQ